MSNEELIDKIIKHVEWIEEMWYYEESSSGKYCVESETLIEYLKLLKH